MKKFVFLSVRLATICLGVFVASADCSIHSKSWENCDQDLRVINVCDLTEQDLNEVMQNHHPEIAIAFSAQTTLPISFFLKGDLIYLVENEGKFGKIEIKQSFYVRCVEQAFIFSSNLTDWKPFLEFITGNASIAFSVQDGQPSIVVGAEANLRL